MDSLSHPFRFAAGRAVSVVEDSDEFAAQMVASAVKTALGELPVTTDFGSLPAEFSRLDTAGVIYSLSKYHPTIVVGSIRNTIAEAEIRVVVEFSRQDQ